MKKSCPTHLYTVGYDETKTLSRTFSKNFVVDDFVPDEQHTPPAWSEKASIRAIPHELASKQTHPKETMRRILRRKVAKARIRSSAGSDASTPKVIWLRTLSAANRKTQYSSRSAAGRTSAAAPMAP